MSFNILKLQCFCNKSIRKYEKKKIIQMNTNFFQNDFNGFNLGILVEKFHHSKLYLCLCLKYTKSTINITAAAHPIAIPATKPIESAVSLACSLTKITKRKKIIIMKK